MVMNTLNAKDIRLIFTELARIMENEKETLTQLDAAIGDGDLGLTMSKGFAALDEAFESLEETDVGKLLSRAGMTLARAVPSTMGTLLATGLMKGGKAITGKTEILLSDFAVFLREFVTGMMARGKAKLGDKTILDSLHPAAEALERASEEGQPLAAGLSKAYQAAVQGVENTKNMISQHGKAACFQEKTLGKKDPGATVGMLFVKGFRDYLSQGTEL
jgi:dihydroxyacetone kinase-like protein